MSKIAAIDVGSNAIRLIIGELDNKFRIQTFKKFREPIRLGRGVFADGKIRELDIRKATRAFCKFRRILAKYSVPNVLAVATSAVRDAKNGKEFIKKIYDASGIPVHLISGDTEANLIYLAVQHKLHVRSGLAFFIDIGGGSVECTFSRNGKLLTHKSFPIGTVRSLAKARAKIIGFDIANVLSADLQRAITYISSTIKNKKVDFCVGTGGNFESMHHLGNILLGNNDSALSVKQIRKILRTVEKYNFRDRVKKIGLKPDRADVIIPAIQLALYLMEAAQCKEIEIPKVGLRDGLLLRMRDVYLKKTKQLRIAPGAALAVRAN